MDNKDLVEYLDWAYNRNWSMALVPWGDKLICHLTVDGVTRSSTGGTVAEAMNNAAYMFSELRKIVDQQ